MKAAFVAVSVIDHPQGGKVPFISPPWFSGHPVHGTDQWLGNIFCVDQVSLNAALADPRVKFVIPVDVIGTNLAWKDASGDVHPSLFGKIVAWVATHGLRALDPNKRNPAQIAKDIMAQASGVVDVDPLFFRIYWE